MTKLLSLRIDTALLNAIDTYATKVGIRRAQAIEILAWLALGRPTPYWNAVAPTYGTTKYVDEETIFKALPISGQFIANLPKRVKADQ